MPNAQAGGGRPRRPHRAQPCKGTPYQQLSASSSDGTALSEAGGHGSRALSAVPCDGAESITRTSEPTGSIDIQSGEDMDEYLQSDTRNELGPSRNRLDYGRCRGAGTWMRHPPSLTNSRSIGTLSVSMVRLSLRTRLILATDSSNRVSTRLGRTSRRAVLESPIA